MAHSQVLKDPKSTKPRWQSCGKPPPAPPAPPPPREEATDTILPPPVTDITDVNDVAPAAVSAGYYNPKGTLQEKFGEHAVEWKQLGTGTSFQYPDRFYLWDFRLGTWRIRQRK